MMYVTVNATKYREQNVSNTSKTSLVFLLTVPYNFNGIATTLAPFLNFAMPLVSSDLSLSSCVVLILSISIAYRVLISVVFCSLSDALMFASNITFFVSSICFVINFSNSSSLAFLTSPGLINPSKPPIPLATNPKLKS